MSTRVEEFLAKAELCERRARAASDPEMQRSYEKLARGWREFAEGPLGNRAPAIEYPSRQSLPEPTQTHQQVSAPSEA
jgi:hypothetical protein